MDGTLVTGVADIKGVAEGDISQAVTVEVGVPGRNWRSIRKRPTGVLGDHRR